MKILFLAINTFPYESADALRTRALLSMIKSKENSLFLLCEHINCENKNNYENIRIFETNPGKSIIEKLLRPHNYLKKLKSIVLEFQPDVIISNCVYDRFLGILKIAKKNSIPIILNSVEWYVPSTFKGGVLSRHWIMFSFAWRRLYTKANGIIAISKLLFNYYNRASIPTIRIPTITDSDKTRFNLEPTYDGRVKMLFAGTFAKTKDSIKEYVKAIDMLDERLSQKFVITICGPSRKDVRRHLGRYLFKKRKQNLNILGRIPQSKVNELYLKNDFGLFFRSHSRSSDAGFSTKIGEGMACGTPFIVNSTGDLGDYIVDGVNGFLITDETIGGLLNTLHRVANLTKEELFELRRQARITASTFFDFKTYQKEFSEFICEVIAKYSNN